MVGRVALVTGGTSGIGRATAEAFLRAGASVMICGRRESPGRLAVKELDGLGDIAFRAADVTDETSVAGLVEATCDRFGRLDYAFNNAANTDAARDIGTFTDMALSEFEGIVRASLVSVWLSMKYELPALVESGGGAVVNTSSMDARIQMAGTGSYAAAKAGCEALTVAAAKEYASKGVRINAVRPGAIRTPMLEQNLDAKGPEGRASVEDAYREIIAMRRLGEPGEVAEAVVWLCSDRSSYVTGHVLTVDGALGL